MRLCFAAAFLPAFLAFLGVAWCPLGCWQSWIWVCEYGAHVYSQNFNGFSERVIRNTIHSI
jgi:hypothetical protein